MKTLTLKRFDRTTTYTLGNLADESGEFDMFILEDAWKDNKRNISCVPTGMYVCNYFNGKKFKDVWQLMAVPKRNAILIHAGNTTDATLGCLLTGNKHQTIGDVKYLLESKKALQRLKDFIGRDSSKRLNPFLLNIVNV